MILIWVNQFPTFSETFIRDHVVQLKKAGLNVKILCNYKNDNELASLDAFKSYGLLNDRIVIDELIPKNKIARVLKVFTLLFLSLFSRRFIVYLRSLNFIKYGKESLNLTNIYIACFLLQNGVKTIHAHFGTNGNKAALFKEIGVPVKLFTTFHGYDIRLGIKKGGQLYQKLFDQANGIIAIADFNKTNLLKFGAKERQLIELPNGIDTEFFKRKENVSLKGEIRLLSVARLAPEKGILFALQALKHIKMTFPDIDIIYDIIGEGPLRQELEAYIEENNLSLSVNLLGRKKTDEVRDLMIVSDIFVLPSLAEVLPTVLLEAQSCAMPILATNVGSVKDMVAQGEIVNVEDIQSLVVGLENLINNRKDWQKMGTLNRAHICQEYDVHTIIKQLIEIYKN